MIAAETWDRLRARAKADNLRLYVTPHGCTIYSTAMIEEPMLSVQVHDIDHSDEVLRAMVGKGLQLLKALHE